MAAGRGLIDDGTRLLLAVVVPPAVLILVSLALIGSVVAFIAERDPLAA